MMNQVEARGLLVAAEAAAQKAVGEALAKYGDRDCCGFAWVLIPNGRGALAKAVIEPDASGHGRFGYKHHKKGVVAYMPGREAAGGAQSLNLFEAGATALDSGNGGLSTRTTFGPKATRSCKGI